jgi:hypothetical protein
MNWIPLTSSNILRVRYDENTNTLEIEFQGGRVYQYFDIPPQIFEGLINASSHGQFFSEQIKGHFRYARV